MMTSLLVSTPYTIGEERMMTSLLVSTPYTIGEERMMASLLVSAGPLHYWRRTHDGIIICCK